MEKKEKVLYVDRDGQVLCLVEKVGIQGIMNISWEELVGYVLKIHKEGRKRFLCIPLPEKEDYLVIQPVIRRTGQEKFSMINKGAIIIRSMQNNLKVLSFKQAEEGKGKCLFEVQL